VQVLEYKQHSGISNNKIELGVIEELLAEFREEESIYLP
jgi:hypothetical protein